MICFKSFNQKIQNAEDKAKFDDHEDQSNKMDLDIETVNGSMTIRKNDQIIIVSEKDANLTAKKIEWSF